MPEAFHRLKAAAHDRQLASGHSTEVNPSNEGVGKHQRSGQEVERDNEPCSIAAASLRLSHNNLHEAVRLRIPERLENSHLIGEPEKLNTVQKPN